MNDFLNLELGSILISIIEKKGSAPRDHGTSMLVTETDFLGTIGGGTLEHRAIRSARAFIQNPEFSKSVIEYCLGPDLGQCCGGRVELSFKKVTSEIKKKLLKKEKRARKFLNTVFIFGAGHVGQALYKQLSLIPFNVSIFDSRPTQAIDFQIPKDCKITPFPEAEIRNSKPNVAYVILTHEHALDFILVKEALKREDAAYIGMIGSETKKGVLKSCLRREGIAGFEKVITPLGSSITNIKGFSKEPSVISSLIATEILIAFQNHKNALV